MKLSLTTSATTGVPPMAVPSLMPLCKRMPHPSSSSLISSSHTMPHAFTTGAFEMRLEAPSTSPLVSFPPHP